MSHPNTVAMGRREGPFVYGLLMAVALLIADVAVVSGQSIPENLAAGKEAYMVRLTDSLPPASNGNDRDGRTEVRSTTRTVDAYWEVDLDQVYAVTHVTVYAASGFEQRMTHATVHLYDEYHDSVYRQELPDRSQSVFEVDCGGPRRARYVRVGFEHKERSSPNGSLEWYLGLKDVAVFGTAVENVGIQSFQAIHNGPSFTLRWAVNAASPLILYPIGSVDIDTDPEGRGEMTLTSDASMEYRLVAESTFETFTEAVTVTVDNQPLPVRINEFVAQNRLSLKDGANNDPDWIELYNPTNAPIDLTGYGLSDDPALPLKWIFPESTIPAHDTLIVFASGSDQAIDPAGYLHTNWRLRAEGESVILTAADGQTVVDQILDYPAQREDLAYGRDMLGRLRFLEPTPGQVNLTETYTGWLEPLVFSHTRGFYDDGFDLVIHHPREQDPDVVIKVSQDGGRRSTPYDQAIPVATTRSVRATVSKEDFKSPRTQTHTYVFVDDVVASSVMRQSITQDSRYRSRLRAGLLAIPSLAIAVDRLPDDYREREASVELLWPDRSIVKQANCGFVRFGGAWAGNSFAKKSYRLKFRKDYGMPKFRAPLFEDANDRFPAVETFDTLDLSSGSHDMSARGFYMAASFVEDSMRDMGSLNPHGRFVHVYLNGTYWGQYYLRERLVEHFLSDYLGGEPEDYVKVRGNDNVGQNFVPGTSDPIGRHTWQAVRANRRSYQVVRQHLDVAHLIDFMLLWLYGDCEHEFRAAGPIDGHSGFKFWIADADGFLRTRALNRNKTNSPGPGGLFGSLISEEDPDFMTLLMDRIHEHLRGDGALTPERNKARLDKRMEEITDSLIAECARWGHQTPTSWQNGALNINNNLFPQRTDQLFGYCRGRNWYPSFGPPEINPAGGPVRASDEITLTADTGTIYYTLDGSDPRLPGGSPSSDARIYSSSTGIQTVLLVPARASWHYWDQGTVPAGAWREAGAGVSLWDIGNAPFGYGDGDEATVIDFGPDSGNKHIAYYFRHVFNVADPTTFTQLDIQLIRDDGAVVYLNGTEVARDNMPEGDIGASTRAITAVGGGEESQWFRFAVPVERLVAGTNVLAVEIHQTSGTSSDISFDLQLEAQHPAPEENSVLKLTADTVVKSRVLSGRQWSPLSEAHFEVVD